MDRSKDGPLSSKELEQDEWREGGTGLSAGDAPGHTLPESESGGDVEGGERPQPNPIAGTMLPPD